MGSGRTNGRWPEGLGPRLAGLAVAAGFGWMLQRGWLAQWEPGLLLFTAAGLLALFVSGSWSLWRSFRPDGSETERPAHLFLVELALLALVVWLIQLTGSTGSPLYPMLFLLLTAVGGFDGSLVNRLLLIVVALGCELIAGWHWLGLDPGTVILHGFFIVGFPFVVGALEWGWLAGQRKQTEAAIQGQRLQAEREAEEYRFQTMTSASIAMPADKRREARRMSSCRQFDQSIGNLLDMLEGSLKPHLVAIFWLSKDEESVRLLDIRPAGQLDWVERDEIPAGKGVIGAVLKGGAPLILNQLRPSYEGLSYYQSTPPSPIRSFIGVALEEEEPRRLLGLLVADRIDDFPFTEDERNLVATAAREILRTHRTEQDLDQIDETRIFAEGVRDATEGLIEAVTPDEVVADIVESVRQTFRGVEFATVLLEDEATSNLVIKAVDAIERFSPWRDQHLNQPAPPGNHLCSLALRNGVILPRQPFDRIRLPQRAIYGEDMDPPGLRSVKIAPLKLASSDGGRSIGVLVVGSTKPSFFPEKGSRADDVERTLTTISNIAAISIQNAKRYQLLEQLATTDGLTGLHNHRRFQEMIDELVQKSMRYWRPLALIMADIDHFKQVNDTYGHPMGDEVLRKVARTLGDLVRSTDKVCRYGGEEFAIILPETDMFGATQLAERFRTEIKKLVFPHEEKPFSITLSLGICTLPDFARHKQELIDRADQALYRAKRTGRDRTVHYVETATRTSPETTA